MKNTKKNELTEIRNRLYDRLPTGDEEASSWQLIQIIKLHLNELDEFIDKQLPIYTVSDCFSFSKYLNEHFEYDDNIDYHGDVYTDKNGDGQYFEEDIFDEWLNNGNNG